MVHIQIKKQIGIFNQDDNYIEIEPGDYEAKASKNMLIITHENYGTFILQKSWVINNPSLFKT